MVFHPKRSRFFNSHLRNNKICWTQSKQSNFSDISLICAQPAYLCGNQADFIRSFLKKKLKKQAKIIIKLKPSMPITKKPSETRMGKGKGSLSYWVTILRPGQCIFKLNSHRLNMVNKVASNITSKLSVKSFCFVKSIRWVL